MAQRKATSTPRQAVKKATPTYRTQRGDNWFNIAQKAKVPPKALVSANAGVKRVRANQMLKIPQAKVNPPLFAYDQQRARARNQAPVPQQQAAAQPAYQNSFYNPTPTALPDTYYQNMARAWNEARRQQRGYAPSPTVLPDTYEAQQQRGRPLPTTLPDTYEGQRNRQMEVTQKVPRIAPNLGYNARPVLRTVWVPPDEETYSLGAGGGAYGGGGGGGWGDGGGGGGGGTYTPQPGYSGFGGPGLGGGGSFAGGGRTLLAGLGLTSWRI